MKVEYIARKVTLTDQTRQVAEKKLAKVKKYFNDILDVRVEVEQERHLHVVDIPVGGNDFVVQSTAQTKDMTAATQVRERMQSNNAKKKVKMAELQAFVSRFSANASKARQATSRARQLGKIELEDIKPSSRVSPFIRFEQEKPLRRLAVETKGLTQAFDEGPLF